MPRIFISDKLGAAGIDLLKASGLDIDNRPGLKDADLVEALRAADGMIVRSETKVTAQLLENPGKLRGMDNSSLPPSEPAPPAAIFSLARYSRA